MRKHLLKKIYLILVTTMKVYGILTTICYSPTSLLSVMEYPRWVGIARNTGLSSLSNTQARATVSLQERQATDISHLHPPQLHVAEALFQARRVEG